MVHGVGVPDAAAQVPESLHRIVVDADDDGSVIHCAVPTAEMLDYATDLKSMTQGRGWFVLSHVRYDPAPQDIADKVIAAAQANA